MSPEIHYWKHSGEYYGALLHRCWDIKGEEIGRTDIIPPSIREVGEWPFFDEISQKWHLKRGCSVTPSYSVTLMFSPALKYKGKCEILPSFSKEADATNPGSLLLGKLIDKLALTFNELMAISVRISSLNYRVKNIYREYPDLFSGKKTPWIPWVTSDVCRCEFKSLISDIRILLDTIIPAFLLKARIEQARGIDKYASLVNKEEIQTDFPIFKQYSKLLLLIADMDNCFKHDPSERGLKLEHLIEPGTKLVRFLHPKQLDTWKIPRKENIKSAKIDEERKNCWVYSVELNALVCLLSNFLSELLGIQDPITQSEPIPIFQISEDWSLRETLPLVKNKK